jgi:hypothetical protein
MSGAGAHYAASAIALTLFTVALQDQSYGKAVRATTGTTQRTGIPLEVDVKLK